MNQIKTLEEKMKTIVMDYHFDYFKLSNNDDRIPLYKRKREMIQRTLMKLTPEDRTIIAFTYLFPENITRIKSKYQKKEYEEKKNLALMSFFRCLK